MAKAGTWLCDPEKGQMLGWKPARSEKQQTETQQEIAFPHHAMLK